MYDQHLISIIIPTYKRPAFLSRTINSALSQTYKHIEVIVVDDNNPDSIHRLETEQVMTSYVNNSNVQYVKHSNNKNGSAARNTGASVSNGTYITFLDDDDEYLPTIIEEEYKLLSSLDDSWGGCITNYNVLNKGKIIQTVMSPLEGDLTKDILMISGSTIMISALLRKEAFDNLKGFNDDYQRFQDWEFFIRFFRKYKLARVKSPLINIHVDSRINQYNFEKVINAKEKFLKEFKHDIEKFPNYKTIYKKQWLYVAVLMLQKQKFSLALETLKKGTKYSPLTFKEYIHLFLSSIDGIFPIKELFKKILN